MRFHIFHILIHVTKKLIAEAVGALEGDSTRFGLASAAVHSYPPAVQTHVLGLYVYVDKDSFRPHYLN